MIYRLYLLDKPGGKPERLILESRDHIAILARLQQELQSGTPPELLWEERTEEPVQDTAWGYFY